MVHHMSKNLKILITRTDRLGDVLLALPTIEYFRQVFPESDIDFLCRPELSAVISPYLKEKRIGQVWFAPGKATREGFQTAGYAGALFLYAPMRLVLTALRARVKWRIGIYSKPYSEFYSLIKFGS